MDPKLYLAAFHYYYYLKNLFVLLQVSKTIKFQTISIQNKKKIFDFCSATSFKNNQISSKIYSKMVCLNDIINSFGTKSIDTINK